MRPTPPAPSERTRRATDTLALIVICGFFFFLGIQLIGLIGPDEPRYAQVAREMLERHDWVTPVLNGKPWLEKPPLYYWCAMIAFKGAGVSDTAARLPTAYLSCLFVIFVYIWSRRFRPGMQLDAALITASSAMIIGFGRSASTDMPLTVMLGAALLSWYGWYSGKNRLWLLLFYGFLSMATLAKGPVAVLLAGVVILGFIALGRDWTLVARTLWPIGIALYLAATAPWFIAVQRANPEFLRVFFLQHNLARFSSNLYHHPQPFWFYLPVALIAVVPWTVFAVAALTDAIRGWRCSVQQPLAEEGLRVYLALWFLVPVVFFSLSRSKLPGYILPAIPALTILLADFIYRREGERAKPAAWMILLHGLLCAALAAGGLIVPFKLLKLPLTHTVIGVAAALGIITIVMLWLTLDNQGYRVLRFVTLVPLVIVFALTLRGSAPVINILQSQRAVEAALEQTALGQLPDIAVYDVPPGVRYGLEFYRNHAVASYQENDIPPGDHIVVAAAGTEKELQYRLPDRKVTRFGGFPWQHLDFFLVSKPNAPFQ